MAPTVRMFGEISTDGESVLELAAWKCWFDLISCLKLYIQVIRLTRQDKTKRTDEYCTFFASKPQMALSR
ncbi:MAG: hypothetical protein VXU42_01085, partial [Verrucomicrobiota bacterium]|nr:hypothetical protein [Verrucomicrobiota bacterium]